MLKNFLFALGIFGISVVGNAAPYECWVGEAGTPSGFTMSTGGHKSKEACIAAAMGSCRYYAPEFKQDPRKCRMNYVRPCPPIPGNGGGLGGPRCAATDGSQTYYGPDELSALNNCQAGDPLKACSSLGCR